MINQEKCILPIMTADLGPRCESLVNVIIVMHAYLLKEE